MATFLFWNVNRRAIDKEIATLCQHHSVDVLILAELKIKEEDFQRQLAQFTGDAYFSVHNAPSSRVKFFFRYATSSITPILDSTNRLSIREIQLPGEGSILVAAVHLSSKLYADSDEQYYQARLVVEAINNAEAKVGHRRTLVIGDFNMNPFEKGLVNADAFHGAMTQVIAQRRFRRVAGVDRGFFYNPMWGKLGDASSGPPGSYYYAGSKNRHFFWNMFDQILLRPDLLSFFEMENLKILTEVGGVSLLKGDVIDQRFSDHLPIMIKLPVELSENLG